MSEQLKMIFEQAGLPADFSEKAQTIFEAAVIDRAQAVIDAEVENIKAKLKTEKDEEVEKFVKEQADLLEGFIDRVVVEWARENAVAIDTNIRLEAAQHFMGALRQAFNEGAIMEPTTKATKLVAESADKVKQLELQLESAQAELVALKQRDEAARREAHLTNVLESVGATSVAGDRVRMVVENMSFADMAEFERKVAIVVESMCGKAVPKNESEDKDEDEADDKEAKGKKDDEDEDDGEPAEIKTESAINPLAAAALALMAGKA